MTNHRPRSVSLGIPAVLAVLFVTVPLVSVIVRVPWSDAAGIVGTRAVRTALGLSLQTSLVAAVVSAVVGVPLAWWLAHASGLQARIVRVLCVAPMVMPPVVGGIALLSAFGRRGVVGQWLWEWWGISLPFTRTSVVMAQVFVAMPFLVLSAEAAFRQDGTSLEEAARTMGAGPVRIFFRVALPAVLPSVLAGTLLAWARAIGEFGASITFAGSFPGRTQTLPMAVYEAVSIDYRQSMVLSLLLILVSLVVLGLMRERWLFGGAR